MQAHHKWISIGFFFLSPLAWADLVELGAPPTAKVLSEPKKAEESSQGIEKPMGPPASKFPESESQKPKSHGAQNQPVLVEKKPVFFEGDIFNGFRKQGFVELEKNVVVTHDDMKITGDRAKVFFLSEQDEVDRVEAYGNVVVTKKDPETHEIMKAYGDIAIYEVAAHMVTMKENAKLIRGKDEFRGAYIEYDVVTGHIKAGKVQGTLTPDAKKNKEKKAATP